MGIGIDTLTEEQQKYLASWERERRGFWICDFGFWIANRPPRDGQSKIRNPKSKIGSSGEMS